jgi:hypothetical protein
MYQHQNFFGRLCDKRYTDIKRKQLGDTYNVINFYDSLKSIIEQHDENKFKTCIKTCTEKLDHEIILYKLHTDNKYLTLTNIFLEIYPKTSVLNDIINFKKGITDEMLFLFLKKGFLEITQNVINIMGISSLLYILIYKDKEIHESITIGLFTDNEFKKKAIYTIINSKNERLIKDLIETGSIDSFDDKIRTTMYNDLLKMLSEMKSKMADTVRKKMNVISFKNMSIN